MTKLFCVLLAALGLSACGTASEAPADPVTLPPQVSVEEQDSADTGTSEPSEPSDTNSPAEEAEPAVERLICPDAGQTGFAADGDLGNHQRKAEGDGQNDIHQQENAAAVLCGQIGESPEVAKTYRRTGRCQHKADAAGKAAS